MMRARSGDAGITLVEMLVALMIFALVGLASFTTLDTILKVRARTDGTLEQIARIDRALLVFGRDLMQADPLSVVLDEATLSAQVPGDDPLRRFVLTEGTLIRQSGPAQTETPLEQPLIAGVSEIRFRVLDLAQVWHESWPEGAAGPQARAAQMTLTLTTGQRLSRTVALPQAVPQETPQEVPQAVPQEVPQ